MTQERRSRDPRGSENHSEVELPIRARKAKTGDRLVLGRNTRLIVGCYRDGDTVRLVHPRSVSQRRGRNVLVTVVPADALIRVRRLSRVEDHDLAELRESLSRNIVHTSSTPRRKTA